MLIAREDLKIEMENKISLEAVINFLFFLRKIALPCISTQKPKYECLNL